MHTIVVGSGSAGAVIAARLTESGAHEITLVEAGPDYPDARSLPADLANGRQNSMRLHDWGYRMKPTAEQTVPFDLPRGRVVGGSSAVNTCIALRPQRYDLDEWAALGLSEWSFDACLPYLSKLETDLDFGREPHHGDRGPLPIRRHPEREWTPWQSAFVEVCERLGHARVVDHNAPDAPLGVGPHAMNKVDGRRISVAEAYLTPTARARVGLHIRARTLVRRALFERGRFAGLEVETSGEVTTLRADRLVLSAGAIGSLGILLRSGVGPRDELARLGVDCVVHSPSVGRRLLDHPGVAILFTPRMGVSKVSDPLIQTMVRYSSRNADHPGDMQTQAGSNLPLAGITFPCVTLMSCVGKPKGWGTIRFPSADPAAKPIVEGRFLNDPADRARCEDAIEEMWRIARTPPLRDMAFPLFPQRRTYETKGGIRAHLPFATGSGYHPCGTAPMSAGSIEDGAVDGRGKLRGVEGVWVADASIMPTVPSSNTNLTAILIGERAAEWLA
ncbi:MAG: GMC family oxidoreductase N-terminal domain-containing protein [Polyangiaceae bacterium]